LPAEILCLADILTPNETEAGALDGFSVMDLNEATRAARRLLESGAGQVIVTRGSGGSCWVQKDFAQVFPSFPVTARDSTAAGAITVTRKGAQDSLPAKHEIEDLLIQYEG
jgi:ribokinase